MLFSNGFTFKQPDTFTARRSPARPGTATHTLFTQDTRNTAGGDDGSVYTYMRLQWPHHKSGCNEFWFSQETHKSGSAVLRFGPEGGDNALEII